MTTLKNILNEHFKSAISAIYGCDVDPMIQPAGRPEFGDFQANFALRLAKQLQLKPIVIANAVIQKLKANSMFAKLEASGPGFINISIQDSFLENHLRKAIGDERLAIEQITTPQTIVVDYGGANVAKEMHIGHLRSAIIGDAIVRIATFVGHNVIRQNHLGDWGTQFGMLIEHLIESGWQVESTLSYSDLNTLYKDAKAHFDADANFAERARARVVALQSGDPTTRAIWQHLVNQSVAYFQETYKRLGVLLIEEDVCGESFYNDMLAPLAKELEQQGVAVIDDSALVIFLEGFVDPDGKPLPFLIRKSDGGYLYATTDLAAVNYRVNTLKAERVLYVVDSRQKQHFAMLFAAANKAWNVAQHTQLEHVAYGSILGEDHKPFKTRSGESVKLNEVLAEAEKRAAELVLQKHPDISAEELTHAARSIGIGALKYADLRSDKIKDYVFSWDKMLAFEGNTGPYLQNAYVRICALFRKGNMDINAHLEYHLHLSNPIEHALAIKLAEFPEIVLSISTNLNLHVLCEYLYDLAGIFHRFYENCPVLSETDISLQHSRLVLCQLTARTLKQGLSLLGINVLERM